MTINRAYLTLPADHAEAQIHYRRAGRLGAPTLVLLHQTPSTSAMYEPLMHSLQDDFDMIALDTPGFGLSDALPGAFSIERSAAAMSAAVSQLHIGPCFWFGHHTGAALALQIADDEPEQVSRLALSGPCLLDQALRERLPQVAAPVPLQADGQHLTTLWARMAAKDAQADISLVQRETLAAAAAGEAYPQAYQAVVDVDTAAQLAALRCPTLVFAGTEDPLYGQLDAAWRLLRDGRKAEIPAARSFVCDQQTHEVAGLLSDFFGEAHV